MTSPFHPGERAIHARLGVRDAVEKLGRHVIRPSLTDPQREFFARLPWLLVGSLDPDGQPHASVLTGAPGFVHAPGPDRLRIDARPEPDDPLADHLVPGAALGLLGLELPARRRSRADGTVAAVDPAGLTVALRRSFGNCPKYIQARDWRPCPRDPGPCERGDGHDPSWRPLVAAADTLFIASHHADPAAGGVDVSHRGGPPGFVRFGADGRLWLPDYAGNFLFNTLGNLLHEPRCGLLFIDFAAGDLLHLACVAEIVWPDRMTLPGEPVPAGAERMLALTPGRWRLRRARLRLAFGPPSPSPSLPK
jgi:predicted pyridoxine 5'-phosphate oxidase superfamily flavin-nucleotide-binding protein